LMIIHCYSHCPTNVTCSQSETCCETPTGLWGCCPFTNGICCQDGIHCCPNNQICLNDGKCQSNSSTTNHFLKGFHLRLNDLPCPDGTSCPDGNTCCQLSSGRYGCCPIPNATCCSDHLHCCPENHQCDDQRGRCKRKVSLSLISEVVCPDDSSCPDGETCCRLSTGDYGCCPLVDAVCCSDSIHCCPRNSQCDVEHGQCLGEFSIPWLTKQPSKSPFNNNDDENFVLINEKFEFDSMKICSSNSTESNYCPSTSFCLLNNPSGSGSKSKCCPIENAIFCSLNGNEICPEGFQCDVESNQCYSNDFGRISMLTCFDSSLDDLSTQLKIIQCPDDKSYCPEETTCCQLKTGSYGCCPYPTGICCSDQKNCCPNGYFCDSIGRCTKHLDDKSRRKSSPMKNLVKQVDQLCPDGIIRCPLTSTCCPNKNSSSIEYSCCPYAKGVCCGSNGSLCCPNNYQCDEKQLSCQLKDENLRSRSMKFDENSFQCSNSDIFCSQDETCCQTYSTTEQNTFACCPFKNGQCCLDGEHCCPFNTHCDLFTGDCIDN